MRPIDYTYTTTGVKDPIPLNIDNIQQQLHIQTLWLNSGAGTYSLQGNLGMVDKTLSVGDYPVQQGFIVPDPDGWFDVQASGTAAMNLGVDDLKKAIPFAFLRANITALSAGSLKVKVLQQSIR